MRSLSGSTCTLGSKPSTVTSPLVRRAGLPGSLPLCLTRAVGPEQPEHFAGIDAEVDATHGFEIGVALWRPATWITFPPFMELAPYPAGIDSRERRWTRMR